MDSEIRSQQKRATMPSEENNCYGNVLRCQRTPEQRNKLHLERKMMQQLASFEFFLDDCKPVCNGCKTVQYLMQLIQVQKNCSKCNVKCKVM